jgi:hypothetical protein
VVLVAEDPESEIAALPRAELSALGGVVDAPLLGRHARQYSLAPTLRLHLGLALTPQLQLFTEANAAFTFSETDLALAGQPAGTLGPWLGTGSLGVRLTTTP